jgi:uncharacterized paraquat-inducible protein A
MPLIPCPKCQYRSPVRSANLHLYAQCLRCTYRFIPQPQAPRSWGRAVIAAVGVLAISALAVAWIILRQA